MIDNPVLYGMMHPSTGERADAMRESRKSVTHDIDSRCANGGHNWSVPRTGCVGASVEEGGWRFFRDCERRGCEAELPISAAEYAEHWGRDALPPNAHNRPVNSPTPVIWDEETRRLYEDLKLCARN